MHTRILHIDMDAFFASVEVVKNPALKGLPVIVGGRKDDTRGVVSTASYEAREFGVHSAMPLVTARKLCPHAVYLPGSMADYSAVSKQIHTILRSVSPLVQMASVDEAYVDITGSIRLFGGEDAIAKHLKERITADTGLPCTVAIASNKLVSKVASGEGKPAGYLNIPSGEEAAFLAPLPIEKLPGAGPKTCRRLHTAGVRTIGDLAAFPEARLMRTFGQGGYSLRRAAQGISNSEVTVERVPKSIGRETTFHEDKGDWQEVLRILMYLQERTLYALREQGMEARCVTLKVRHSDFSTFTYGATLPSPTALDVDIQSAVAGLVAKAQSKSGKIRLIGISVSQLTHNQHQLNLFSGKRDEKWEKTQSSVDDIRKRHGFDAMRTGKSMALGKKVKFSNPSLSK
jgi:DNA polymerase IV